MAGLLIAAASVFTPAGVQADLSAAPAPSSLTAAPFTSAGFVVTVRANRSVGGDAICLDASKSETGRDVQTIVTEWACTPASNANSWTYRFAPVRWVGLISGPVGSTRTTRQFRRGADGDWNLVSQTDTPSRVSLGLRWTGQGDSEVERSISGFPLSCLAAPPICTRVTVGMRRDAEVRGSVTFHGIGVTASVPAGHRGVMTQGH